MRQKFITKCFRFFNTKSDKFYYNLRQLLKMHQFCYKVRQLLQIAKFITKYVDTRGPHASVILMKSNLLSYTWVQLEYFKLRSIIIFLSIFISFILNQSQFHFQFHLFYLEMYLFPFFISQKVLTTSPQFNFLIRLELMSNFNYLGHSLL